VNNVIKEVKNGKQFIISKLVRNFFWNLGLLDFNRSSCEILINWIDLYSIFKKLNKDFIVDISNN
jgi:hypothetical protein